jgi:hypothetical protein
MTCTLVTSGWPVGSRPRFVLVKGSSAGERDRDLRLDAAALPEGREAGQAEVQADGEQHRDEGEGRCEPVSSHEATGKRHRGSVGGFPGRR